MHLAEYGVTQPWEEMSIHGVTVAVAVRRGLSIDHSILLIARAILLDLQAGYSAPASPSVTVLPALPHVDTFTAECNDPKYQCTLQGCESIPALLLVLPFSNAAS